MLKPINPTELLEAVNRFQKLTSQKIKVLHENLGKDFSETKKIGISHSNGIELILPDEIIYIKGEGAYSEIHLTDGKKILASKNLKMFEENLAENPQFIRVHKSYIVNFNHLISINKSNGGTIIMTNQMEIPFNSDSYELILEKINLIKK